jgi:hypothetical protein
VLRVAPTWMEMAEGVEGNQGAPDGQTLLRW